VFCVLLTRSYIGHLLGHESGGSILSALKQKLWANGLSAGTYLNQADFACFTLTVELSDEGVNHVDEVVACIFAYIGKRRQRYSME
jgi:secreted Zn-dependent insulinase-like peptidase